VLRSCCVARALVDIKWWPQRTTRPFSRSSMPHRSSSQINGLSKEPQLLVDISPLDVLTAVSAGFCRLRSLGQNRISCAAVLLPRSKYACSSHLLMSTHCLYDADLYIALMIFEISTFFSSPQLPFSGSSPLPTFANKDSNCLR
jgi:hypothetical protein